MEGRTKSLCGVVCEVIRKTCQRRSATPLFSYNKSIAALGPAHGSSQLHDRIELEYGLDPSGVAHGRAVAHPPQYKQSREYLSVVEVS